MRINAAITETLMHLGDMSIDETWVYMESKKFGSFQAHVLAEELEGKLNLIEVNKALLGLEKRGKVKRIESLRLGTMWKVV